VAFGKISCIVVQGFFCKCLKIVARWIHRPPLLLTQFFSPADHVEELRSAAAAADAEALTVPSPSPSKCEPIISSPGRKKKKLLSISICFFFPCNAHSNLLHSSSKNASQRSYYYILNSVTMGLLLSSFREL